MKYLVYSGIFFSILNIYTVTNSCQEYINIDMPGKKQLQTKMVKKEQ